MPIRVASIAETDIVSAAQWYERNQVGLGDQFLSAVDAAFVAIEAMPLACPTMVLTNAVLKLLRWLSLRGFPYLVVFVIDADGVLVIGVFHTHQDLQSLLLARVGVQ